MSYHPSIVESLAEELVAVRERLTDLKRREAEVRDALLSLAKPANGQVRIPTQAAVVCIEHRKRARFEAKRLPAHIRDDPRYQVAREATYVRVLPAASKPQTRVRPARAPRDGFDVIERF